MGGPGQATHVKGLMGVMYISRISVPFTIVGLLFFGGCSILPSSGPLSSDVRAGQKDPEGLQYALVRLTPNIVDILARAVPRLANAFVDRSPPKDIRFGVGDVVTVTIFEAAAGGLFIPAEAGVRPGNFITLPNQSVDSKGNISVPYAGDVRAKGLKQVEVQENIVNALKNRAIEPQAVVSLVDQRTSLISVLGDVNTPSRFPASQAGEHILDAITRAGGPKNQGYDEWVMLEREGRRALAPFGALVYEPNDNIYVHPNDTIYLYREPQTFLAFGAFSTASGATTGGQGSFSFDAYRISLAEAVAKAGGASDLAADSSSVFLYRGETREVATELGIDCSKFQGPIIPVVYDINLREPAGYLVATKFEVRNKDVIFISNAPSVEMTKAMTFFQTVVGTVNDPIVAAINVYALKAVAKAAQ
ncbi:MAG TPA: polysaccharide biosynthesis/export family protein [Candidatus Acidoferrum sp.]|nr:polysaccharide biosynthesis/export family protein [Candidatus Acidoferrum sp.]